jgi:hypothetical protein
MILTPVETSELGNVDSSFASLWPKLKLVPASSIPGPLPCRRGFQMVLSTRRQRRVLFDVCDPAILAQSKPFSGDLFHSNPAPENQGSIREKTPLSRLSKWNNLAD